MTIRVLVVDDSSFFRRRLTEILSQDAELEVIATANNGKEAVEKALALRPDVITMDIEMPVMDGIAAVREILKVQRTPILMFSSLTHEGAKATLDALEAGAIDFLPKKFEDIARDKAEAADVLRQRVKTVARRRVISRPSSLTGNTGSTLSSRTAPVPAASASASTARAPLAQSLAARALAERAELQNRAAERAESQRTANFESSGKNYKLVAIGTSTGGPVALQQIITALPANFPLPIVLIQHMPAAFTGAFAARLNGLAKIEVKEAADNDILRPGVAYLAPGGKQMLVDGNENQARLRVREDDSPRITFKPSVDITFGTAAKVFNDKVLAIVLTGMGSDGREGARLLKQSGSRIWAQDEASCVVYGMPQAVTAAGLTHLEVALSDVANRIIAEVGNG
ncbi:MAG: chemotaxis response regulator protein-glutamate methylesterase [Gammaproteobacteria bacterium]|nr:chemotaxis response regulator protein-glutamate methylesterase [Gammaproteobacteria bacterium]MBU2058429.1 chemotaxis response regulator protein-glutamate methylesterase [Gammaproteobacteria bacterium]MBU2176518.1 chemotaxis response regulator protein-glutamate methylesterase [Gammaproteobacteria bacterium]MBU2248540.1 chemotaxis response regulator protein-glutamate methylesterase [Gammaproteobacteria bacterium]MBU2345597.1 chemotaxis response regulator protein-glutamate methylesterase [Gamm